MTISKTLESDADLNIKESREVPRSNPDEFEMWAESVLLNNSLEIAFNINGQIKGVSFWDGDDEFYAMPGDVICRTVSEHFYVK